MSFATLATMALGGAALGALANPEDREKGALIGLGLGALGPLAGMAGIGGGGVLGTSLGAGTAGAGTAGGALATGGTTTATTTGAGTTGALTKTVAPIVDLSSTTSAINTNAAALAKEQAATKLAEQGAKKGAEEVAKKTVGDRVSGFMSESLPGMGVAAVQSALAPKPNVSGPAPQNLSLPVSQTQRVNPYERSLINMQARMKQRQQPRRFV